MGNSFATLAVTLVASLILIIIGLVYFMVALWIIKFGSGLLGYAPSSEYAVLSASIVTVGSMIGSSLKQ